MNCSKCSEVVKPVVAIDIDGTLGDYHGHFLWFAGMYLGVDITHHTRWAYSGNEPFSMWFVRAFDTSLDEYRQIKLAYRQAGMKRSMPIFDGARALCWAVRDAGAELWVTTTRPYLSLDNIVPDTVEWLKRHEIEYDGMLFDADKYEQLAKRVDPARVVAVLDDLHEQLAAAAGVLGWSVPILIKGNFNKRVGAPVMCDLDASCDIVLHRIQEWEHNYGNAA